MVYERINEPEPSADDVVTIRKFSPYINELTISQATAPEFKSNVQHTAKKQMYQSKFQIAKALKRARESIFTNIEPDDLPYTRFITLTKSKYMTLENAQKAWKGFLTGLEKDLGKFNSFAVFEKTPTYGYHIHAIISDPNHGEQFKWFDYRVISNNWFGSNKVVKIRNIEHLISTAFYITKLRAKNDSTHFDNVPVDQSLVIINGALKSVPTYEPFDSYSVDDMKEYLTNSYKMSSDGTSKIYTRKLFIKNQAAA